MTHYRSPAQLRVAAERAKRIRERSGPDSLEWIQSSLFLYAAYQEGLKKDLHQAVWAYTAAMIDKLENILTDAKLILGSNDIVKEYEWAAKQLRVAIARHLKLLKMFEGEEDIQVPPATEAGQHIVEKVHNPSDQDAGDAIKYVHQKFKSEHPGYSAVIPDDLDQYF